MYCNDTFVSSLPNTCMRSRFFRLQYNFALLRFDFGDFNLALNELAASIMNMVHDASSKLNSVSTVRVAPIYLVWRIFLQYPLTRS